jgi:hypothetical protein
MTKKIEKVFLKIYINLTNFFNFLKKTTKVSKPQNWKRKPWAWPLLWRNSLGTKISCCLLHHLCCPKKKKTNNTLFPFALDLKYKHLLIIIIWDKIILGSRFCNLFSQFQLITSFKYFVLAHNWTQLDHSNNIPYTCLFAPHVHIFMIFNLHS